LAESSLSITFWDLRREVARACNFGRAFDAGTIAIAAGVVTLSGGAVWPLDAANYRLVNKATGTMYTINTRDTDTQVTLDNLGVTIGGPLTHETHPWTDDELTDLRDYINSGLSQFYTPVPMPGEKFAHYWSFLRPTRDLTTTLPYSTGTVGIVNGVVTLTAGTWPTWAASGELVVLGVTYTVNTRDSGAQLTLDDLTVNVTAGATFQLVQAAYELPDDWGGRDSEFTYRPGASVLYGPVHIVGEEQIRILRQQGDWTGRPQCAAIRPKPLETSTGEGQRWEWLPYPMSDGAYPLTYRYRVIPNELSATNPYPYGGQNHRETILESCLAAAEHRHHEGVTRHHQERFQALLIASVSFDRQQNTPHTVGFNTDRSDGYEVDPSQGTRLTPGIYTTFEGVLHNY